MMTLPQVSDSPHERSALNRTRPATDSGYVGYTGVRRALATQDAFRRKLARSCGREGMKEGQFFPLPSHPLGVRRPGRSKASGDMGAPPHR